MKRLFLSLSLATLVSISPAAELELESPQEYQIVQRHSKTLGDIPIRGQLKGVQSREIRIEAKLKGAAEWSFVPAEFEGDVFSGRFSAPAGGWYSLEIRVLEESTPLASATVAKVGVGEIFVVAGQSNSANHGEEVQNTKTGKVASFDGTTWHIANDPQPGASGKRGSFMPSLGDALVDEFEVPVGFVACGIGATSVREWLPKGSRFPNPPTIEKRVEKQRDGTWISKGEAYEAFLARIAPLGPNGFRAVLWHQGESDANQKDPTRTLQGSLYRDYLETLITQSREDAGYSAPWFVAQASYHSPDDPGSPEIRAAQASLWHDGIAFQGPDSDALQGPLRERDGQGVHFSGPGLRAHGKAWAEKLIPWLETEIEAD